MIVDCAVYEAGKRVGGSMQIAGALAAVRRDGHRFVWIGLHEPTAEEFDAVAREFDLHPLAVEDAIHAHQRPKLETYGDSLFVVLKTARYVEDEEVVRVGQVMLFIGAGFVVSVRHGAFGGLTDIRRQLEGREHLLRCGAGAVLHAVVDHVVDDYAAVLAGLDGDVDEIEDRVFTPRPTSDVERIYKLKREVLEFKRAVVPLVNPLSRLSSTDLPHVHGELHAYFRDVLDHVTRDAEQVEQLDSLLDSILYASLAQVGVQQNADMRRISAWVAIAAVPTMIAGIYGMNFEHMPELSWRYGYPLVLLVMAGICLSMYRAFRRNHWL